MSGFKVEKNVPLPKKAAGKYPFAEMEVNDSFFAPGVRYSLAHHSATTKLRAQGWEFRGREEIVNGVAGMRVWRTK